MYRGKLMNRAGIPYLYIANRLGRDAGEVCRWFNGRSPEWANLLVTMTALDVDWNAIGELPTKRERRETGYAEAMLYVRRRVLGEKFQVKTAPSGREIMFLEQLFRQAGWAVERRFEARRRRTLETVAVEINVGHETLDAVDREWGNAFAVCLKCFSESIDPSIWS